MALLLKIKDCMIFLINTRFSIHKNKTRFSIATEIKRAGSKPALFSIKQSPQNQLGLGLN